MHKKRSGAKDQRKCEFFDVIYAFYVLDFEFRSSDRWVGYMVYKVLCCCGLRSSQLAAPTYSKRPALI